MRYFFSFSASNWSQNLIFIIIPTSYFKIKVHYSNFATAPERFLNSSSENQKLREKKKKKSYFQAKLELGGAPKLPPRRRQKPGLRPCTSAPVRWLERFLHMWTTHYNCTRKPRDINHCSVCLALIFNVQFFKILHFLVFSNFFSVQKYFNILSEISNKSQITVPNRRTFLFRPLWE